MEYSVRYNLKRKQGGYSSLVTIDDDNGKTKKYSLEGAKKAAHERLNTLPHCNDFEIPYCKIYEGRKCIETIYK